MWVQEEEKIKGLFETLKNTKEFIGIEKRNNRVIVYVSSRYFYNEIEDLVKNKIGFDIICAQRVKNKKSS